MEERPTPWGLLRACPEQWIPNQCTRASLDGRRAEIHCLHDGSDDDAARAFSTKARTLAGSLRPGAASTPEATSTPQGRRTAIASATLAGLSPPAAIRRAWLA